MKSLLNKIVYFPLKLFVIIRNHIYTYYCKKIDYKDIPIYINNRNRITFLKQLIEFLEKKGYKNIIILDNNSTYPQLLEYYKNIPYRVIFLNKNMGFLALENIEEYHKLRKQFFVYTDSDVVPIAKCPFNFLEIFREIMIKNPSIQKVGFSLKIDDLPDHFIDKNKVISWESKFYKTKSSIGYEAPIDTTFALHRPFSLIGNRYNFRMIRMTHPFEAYHMPWYNDSENLTDEEKYYISHVEIGTHWSKGLKLKKQLFISKFFNILK